MNNKRMQFHPVAELFPMMSDTELAALRADVRTNDLREAIFLAVDPADNIEKIADGRNRYEACIAEGVTPRFRKWDGKGDLVSIVVSLNLHRRHLSESQRAMVAAKLANMRQGERTDLSENSGRFSQEAAAKALKVSPDLVGSAKKVREKGVSELVQAVEAGEISVTRAATIAKASPRKQKSIIKKGRASGRKLITNIRAKALKNTEKGWVGCLHCNPDAKFTEEGVAAFMEKLAHRAAAWARANKCQSLASYFEGVAFDIAEGELSSLQMENAEKLLAIIDAGTIGNELGIRERNDLQRLSKIPWPQLDDLIAKMLNRSIEAVQQEGETDVARGAKKTLYRRIHKTDGASSTEALDPDFPDRDVYLDRDNW